MVSLHNYLRYHYTPPAWARLDRNGDGRIDANEWTYAP